jgi:hypothetical protein
MPDTDGITAEHASTVVFDIPRDGVAVSVVMLTVLAADAFVNCTLTAQTTVVATGTTSAASSRTRWS